jgi:hypothetical protein
VPTAAELPEGISQQHLDDWYDRFRSYRRSPSRDEILAWLTQFQPEHVSVAKKVLDNVILIADEDIVGSYRDALNAIPGWSRNEAQRKGRWAFLGLGGQAESGAAMLHIFREANELEADKYQPLFGSLSDLPSMQLTAADTVIFVDDFAGTGDQFADRWEKFQELIASEARTFLFLAAATSRAVERLAGVEDLELRVGRRLKPCDNVFSEECTTFKNGEKETVLQYCHTADPRCPRGWGDCGLLLVISRKTPNNSLPILHVDVRRRWKGLFPRRLRPPAVAGAAA